MVDNVPSNCSNREFIRHFQSIEGIRSIYFGHPLICPAQGLYRFAWITCENQDVCDAVLKLLGEEFKYYYSPLSKDVKNTHLHGQMQPAFKKQAFLPSLLNQESYIEEDLTLCYKVLHALEHYYVTQDSAYYL